jgi:hypothetical protein
MTDAYVLFMSYSLSIDSPWALLYLLFCGTDLNDLTGLIPSELQSVPLSYCSLRECRIFSLNPILPLCMYYACRVFLIRLPS